jgi:hypothetical protein
METPRRYSVSDVLQRIEYEQAWWQNATRDADAAAMEQPDFAGTWSFKDVVNHLDLWQGWDIAELKAARGRDERPKPEWPADIEAIENKDERVQQINEWASDRDKDVPADFAISKYSEQLEELFAFAFGLSDDEVNDTGLFPNLDGRSLGEAIVGGWFFRHTHDSDEHGPDMSKWIGARSLEHQKTLAG